MYSIPDKGVDEQLMWVIGKVHSKISPEHGRQGFCVKEKYTHWRKLLIVEEIEGESLHTFCFEPVRLF